MVSSGQLTNRPPATAMVAVPAGYQAHQIPGHGCGNGSTLSLPYISLRKATTMQFMQWNIALENVVAMSGLTQVVADGKPPTRDAIAGLYSGLSMEEIDERFYDALRQYQEENTYLYYAFAHSITLDGEWHTIDLEYILENFSRGTVRDGNGYLQ